MLFSVKQAYSSSKNPRDQETYEADTVRVELITHENIDSMLATYAKK